MLERGLPQDGEACTVEPGAFGEEAFNLLPITDAVRSNLRRNSRQCEADQLLLVPVAFTEIFQRLIEVGDPGLAVIEVIGLPADVRDSGDPDRATTEQSASARGTGLSVGIGELELAPGPKGFENLAETLHHADVSQAEQSPSVRLGVGVYVMTVSTFATIASLLLSTAVLLVGAQIATDAPAWFGFAIVGGYIAAIPIGGLAGAIVGWLVTRRALARGSTNLDGL